METQSEVVVDVHVQLAIAAEEVSMGAKDQGAVFGDKACKDLVVVSMMAEEKVLVTAGIVVPAMKDDEMEVEKCSDQEVQTLEPANGGGDCKAPVEADGNGSCYAAKEQEGCDGDGKAADAADEKNTPVSGAREVITDVPCTVVTPEPVAGMERASWNGDGDGDGDGEGKAPAMDEMSSLPQFIPVAEDNEPAWGDVLNDVRLVPILPIPQPLKRTRIAPECKEVDDVVQSMRNILFNLTYADDAHLTPEDEEKVRDLLEYHPKAHEKIGSGIDFIKIKRHDKFKDVRCFWVVRTDGTETDFSYHKCLKEKVAKENPGFMDRYDAIYRAPKRPRME